jgi:predicted nucleotidyltransferase
MLLTDDMRELLALLAEHGVEHVLVGGIAVNYYGYVRSTQDLDILIVPSIANARRITRALRDFGFGDAGIPAEAFERPGSAIHLGVEPNRVDLLTGLKGVDPGVVYRNARDVDLQGLRVRIIELDDLVASKRASGRLRDQADAEELEVIRRSR